MRTRRWAALGLATVAALWGGAGYLTTSPTDFHDYRVAAVGAARSAHDALATVSLTGHADLDGRVARPYVRSVLSDARDALAGAAKRFAGVAPPDPPTVRMRDRLGPLLVAANTRLAAVETAVDDDDPPALRRAVVDLDPVTGQLATFIEENR